MEYRGLKLDPFQETAIRHLQEDRSVLVAAPTGTGKTLVADWIVDEALSSGRRVIYTAPIKALSNQKFRDYTRLWGEENVGLVTGDRLVEASRRRASRGRRRGFGGRGQAHLRLRPEGGRDPREAAATRGRVERSRGGSGPLLDRAGA